MIARLTAPDSVLTYVAFLLLPLAVIAPRMIPVLGGLSALALIFAGARSGRYVTWATWRRLGPLPFILLALVIWSAVSAIWSPSVGDSLDAAFKMAAIWFAAVMMLFAALDLDQIARARIGAALALGTVITTLYMAVELATDMPATRFLLAMADSAKFWQDFPQLYLARATSVAVLIAWPVALVLRRRFGLWAAAGMILLLLWTLTQTWNSASLLAVLVSLFIFLLASWRAKWAASAVVAACLVAALSAPAMTHIAPVARKAIDAADLYQSSARHRLVIWEFAAEKIQERPVFGWGMNAARHLGTDRVVNMRLTADGTQSIDVPVMSLHPHNGMVQAWLELGIPGMLLGLALFLLAVRWVVGSQLSRPAVATGLAGIASGLIVFQVSYGAWQGWWQTSVWIAIALGVAILPMQTAATGKPGE